MKNNHTPEIRFAGFSGEWEQLKLGEVVEIKDSARISNALWVSRGVPYLRSSDLANDEIEGELFISDETYQSYKDKTGAPEKDDVLFTSGGKIGVTYHKIDDNPVYVQGGSILYAKTSTSSKLSGMYLKAFFSSPMMTKYIEEASTGLTIKHFTLKPANAAPIFISSLKEQNAIGEFFKQLDDNIALHQQELTTLKQTKQGFLQKMFPKEGESVPDVRFPGFIGDWEQCKLDSMVDRLKSYSLSRDVETNDYTGYKYIHYGDIHKKVADIIDESSNLPNIKAGNYELLEKGDLVLADASEDYQGIATPAVITIDMPYKLVSGLHTIALRPKQVDSLFLYYLISSPIFREYGYTVGTGMKVFGISVTNLLKFEGIFPSLEEQTKIGSFFKQLDNTIALHQRELDTLKKTKKAFLQKMFV
ncbi:restriction endonuclease subunit S [Bacillus mycoides]|uniref:restriction endonuclease subunit S n=1 Tax=Bacillus mycoides TaxID=1405 RepID=UPI0003E2A906|nr:restriction endonuclease subunit S [Bacillus mycoides]ETT74543.1 type I restriction-modification system specificity subunit [Bacillus mycoides FSL H7-687]HDR7565085.1 restriction endonuclease subunit S [Bacillus mycoides]